MLIAGVWVSADGAEARPLIRGQAVATDGSRYADDFLVDTGADYTVLSADLFGLLGLGGVAVPSVVPYVGIGGASSCVEFDGAIEFIALDGTPVVVKGRYAAFTDPDATAHSILGRNVLDLFDLII